MEIQKLFVSLVLDATKYTKGLDESQREATRWQKAQGAAFKAFQAAALAALAVVVAATIAFAKDSLREFQQFETGISEVFTLLPGLSQDAMGQMKEDVLAFGKEVGRTSDETLPALYQAISAGVPKENVFDFLKIASDAALGGVTDLETAVDGITSVTNAYGASVIDAATASDVMFTAVKLGKTDFEQLSSSLFNVVPTAASLGVTFTDVAANLAALTAQGTPTSVATTQLRAAFVEASKAGSGLDKALRDLTGKGFADLIADGQTSSEIFSDLRQSMPEEEFRNLFSSVEASNAVLGLTNDTAKGIIDTFGTVEDTLGATAEAAETMAQSMEHLEAKTAAATEALKIQTGEALSPLKRAWLETKLGVSDYLSEDLRLRQQLLRSSDALGEFGYEGVALQKALGALGEGTTFWRNTLVDADTLARRTTIAVGLLENGFQGGADTLADAVQVIEAANNASNDYVTTLDDLRLMAYEQEAAQEAANQAHTEWIELGVSRVGAATDYAMSLEELARMGRDAANVQREELAIATEEAAAAAEAAAEAERVQAQALAELRAQVGGYFNDALTATGETKSLERQMYDAAVAAGAGATELAILAQATGEFTQEEIDAAFQAALMRSNIDGLVEAMQAGAITADQATDALGLLKSGQAETAAGAISLIQQFDGTVASLGNVSDAATDATSNLTAIPSNIPVHISITSDPIPSLPNVPGGGNQPQAFSTGGFTGFGAVNDVAGLVHRNELVIPSDVLSGGFAEIMNFAKENLPSRFSLDTSTAPPALPSPTPDSGRTREGDTYIFNIDAPGGDVNAIEKAVERAMAKSGRKADTRIRAR